MTHAHYRLTSDEFLSINSKLTNAQLRVYLHYKTLDPFGDRRVEICTKAIAETLGLARRTVQAALNFLASKKLIVWQKIKSFVTAHTDAPDDPVCAVTHTDAPERIEMRERQLELNLGEDSTNSQSSSNLFNLIHDQGNEIFNEDGVVNNYGGIDDNNEISVEEAIAEIRLAIPDTLCSESHTLCTESHTLCSESDTHEDLHLSTQHHKPEDFQQNLEPKSDLQLTNFRNTNGTDEGKPSRAAVEKFVLKTLNKSFTSAAQRAAYFSKFDANSWKKWETQYKASLIPQAPYKPYIPEKVEVAPPDSPLALSAIAQIKAKLGIKK